MTVATASTLDRTAPRAWRAPAAGPQRLAPDARAALLAQALQPVVVPQEATQAMARLTHEQVLPAGSPVFARAAPAHSLWLVAAGKVALGTHKAQGLAQQTRRVEAGQWLDASSAWLGGAHLEDAWTQTTATVWAFPLDRLRECGVQHPALLEGLLGVLSARVGELTQATHELMLKDAEARCATWMLQHPGLRPGPGGSASLTLNERKRAIASQLGVTPETFSRVLRHLRTRGLIEVAGYVVRILDTAALARIAAINDASR